MSYIDDIGDKPTLNLLDYIKTELRSRTIKLANNHCPYCNWTYADRPTLHTCKFADDPDKHTANKFHNIKLMSQLERLFKEL